MDTQLTDLWRFLRPSLAQGLFAQVVSGTSGRLALFGPRRTGKTSLICREILPLAKNAGLFPVYCDCWQDRKDPLGSILYAFKSALEALEVPTSKTGRVLKTEVKKLAAAGFSIEFGAEPRGDPPASPYFQLDWLLGAIIARARKPVFLIIDEVQGIAEHKEAERIAGALRAAITRHEHAVRVLFTGSSETQLTKLFAATRASLYQFASRVAYSPLDAEFVAHVAHRFHAATRRQLNQGHALEIFRLLGNQPEAFLSVVQTPLALSDCSLQTGLEALLSPHNNTPWTQYWRESTALQQALLIAASDGFQVTTEEGLTRIGALMGTTAKTASSVSRAASALTTRGLIERSSLSSKSIYALTDPVFELWLRQNGTALLKGTMPLTGSRLPPTGHREPR
jgi:hypothetical protein